MEAPALAMEPQDRAVVSYVFDRLRTFPIEPCALPMPLSEWPGYSLDRTEEDHIRVLRGDSLVQVFYPAAWVE
jgi:hypothetical protein